MLFVPKILQLKLLNPVSNCNSINFYYTGSTAHCFIITSIILSDWNTIIYRMHDIPCYNGKYDEICITEIPKILNELNISIVTLFWTLFF